MTTEEITDKVIKIVHEQCFGPPSTSEGAPKLTPETNIQNNQQLGIDSLDFLEIVVAVEEEFDVVITDEEGDKLSTISDVVKFIEEFRKR